MRRSEEKDNIDCKGTAHACTQEPASGAAQDWERYRGRPIGSSAQLAAGENVVDWAQVQ